MQLLQYAHHQCIVLENHAQTKPHEPHSFLMDWISKLMQLVAQQCMGTDATTLLANTQEWSLTPSNGSGAPWKWQARGGVHSWQEPVTSACCQALDSHCLSASSTARSRKIGLATGGPQHAANGANPGGRGSSAHTSLDHLYTQAFLTYCAMHSGSSAHTRFLSSGSSVHTHTFGRVGGWGGGIGKHTRSSAPAQHCGGGGGVVGGRGEW